MLNYTSGVASIGPGQAFARPLIRQKRNLRSKNNIYSKEEEQEEPKSLPPDAFPGLQICHNCFFRPAGELKRSPDPLATIGTYF